MIFFSPVIRVMTEADRWQLVHAISMEKGDAAIAKVRQLLSKCPDSARLRSEPAKQLAQRARLTFALSSCCCRRIHMLPAARTHLGRHRCCSWLAVDAAQRMRRWSR